MTQKNGFVTWKSLLPILALIIGALWAISQTSVSTREYDRWISQEDQEDEQMIAWMVRIEEKLDHLVVMENRR